MITSTESEKSTSRLASAPETCSKVSPIQVMFETPPKIEVTAFTSREFGFSSSRISDKPVAKLPSRMAFWSADGSNSPTKAETLI